MAGRRYPVWVDRSINVGTGVLVVAALFIVATERVLPRLRGAPEPIDVGATLPRQVRFEPLSEVTGGPAGGRAADRARVPGERPTLLLGYASTCPACTANLPAWRAVMAAARGALVLAVALERDRVAALDYARNRLPSAVPVRPARLEEFLDLFGVRLVPFTGLVASDGRLTFRRSGVLDTMDVTRLRDLLRPKRSHGGGEIE